MLILVAILSVINFCAVIVLLQRVKGHNTNDNLTTLNELKQEVQVTLNRLLEKENKLYEFSHQQVKEQQQQRASFDSYRIKSLKTQQESLALAMSDIRKQISATLNQNSRQVSEKVDSLTKTTERKLKEISGEVDKQLTAGFEKTTATFTDILKRLTIIDQAQKKITELSHSVVNLQEVLTDKRSRGAFGEMQLSTLIQNMLPPQHFSEQHTLSNNKRVDCILFLPQPTGNLAIDAKFPLENYRMMHNQSADSSVRKKSEQLFIEDIKRHIDDISSKYIIPNETANGAVMFLPAEAIFAEIHAHYPELVEIAQRKNVWLVSPTTMMAVITTAKAVLKDEATRKQVQVIQEHLVALGKDFDRFQARMDNLSKHIDQAQADVAMVHKSSKKISNRFSKIEQVELNSASFKEEAGSKQKTELAET